MANLLTALARASGLALVGTVALVMAGCTPDEGTATPSGAVAPAKTAAAQPAAEKPATVVTPTTEKPAAAKADTAAAKEALAAKVESKPAATEPKAETAKPAAPAPAATAAAAAESKVAPGTVTESKTETAESAKEAAEKAAADKAMNEKLVKEGWLLNLDEGLKAAKAQNKLVFVDFWADWCGFCKMMDAQTYPDAKVKAALDKYVKVRIDADKQKELADKYQVEGLPTMLVVDAAGKTLARVGDAMPPEAMVQFLTDVPAYLEAKKKLAKDPKDAEAAFTAAEKALAVEATPEERMALVTSALALVKKDDVTRRPKLLLMHGYLTAMADPTKMDEAAKEFEAAAAADSKNEAGVKEEADWIGVQARFHKSKNNEQLIKDVVDYLAAYPRDKMKNGEIRNQALGLQYKLQMDREDFAGALKTLETVKAENKDFPNMEQLDEALQQAREQLKAQQEAKAKPPAAGAANVKSGEAAPKQAPKTDAPVAAPQK